MLEVVLLVLGFLFIVKGADFLVDGSSSLAKRFGISDIAIGLTIVAFGATSPEFMVNVFAGLSGKSQIALSTALGNNIISILLILGIAALIHPLRISRDVAVTEIPLVLLASLVLGILANDRFFDYAESSTISRTDGLVLIAFFVIFIHHIFEIARSRFQERKPAEIQIHNTWRSLLLIAVGFLGLYLGGQWVLRGAVATASYLGLTESFVAITIISFGMSLPEIVMTIIAAHKKHDGLAVGNVIGSVIFNTFLTLGVTSAINPIPVGGTDNASIFMVAVACLLLFLIVIFRKKPVLRRWQGFLFLVLYFSYIIFLVTR